MRKLQGWVIERYAPRLKRLNKEYEGDGYSSGRSYMAVYNELLPCIRTELNKRLLNSICAHKPFSVDPIIEQITEDKEKDGNDININSKVAWKLAIQKNTNIYDRVMSDVSDSEDETRSLLHSYRHSLSLDDSKSWSAATEANDEKSDL